MSTREKDLEAELERIVRATPWLVGVLEAVRGVSLPDAYVAAGAIRNTVWETLHRGTCSEPCGDIDVVYFDTTDAHDGVGNLLRTRLPDQRWELTNQATVHHWQSTALSRQVDPYGSVAEALACWPETATAVGVRLMKDGALDIVAPYGLEDLFSLTVRPSPALVDSGAYRARWQEKGWLIRWPRLTVVPLPGLLDRDTPATACTYATGKNATLR